MVSGFAGLGLEDQLERGLYEPCIYYSPDGSASIARLAVRSLIPSVARGHAMEDVVLACYNMMIPYLMPELPDARQQALALGVKLPLVYQRRRSQLACVRQSGHRPDMELVNQTRTVWYRGLITLPATLVLLSLAACLSRT